MKPCPSPGHVLTGMLLTVPVRSMQQVLCYQEHPAGGPALQRRSISCTLTSPARMARVYCSQTSNASPNMRARRLPLAKSTMSYRLTRESIHSTHAARALDLRSRASAAATAANARLSMVRRLCVSATCERHWLNAARRAEYAACSSANCRGYGTNHIENVITLHHKQTLQAPRTL